MVKPSVALLVLCLVAATASDGPEGPAAEEPKTEGATAEEPKTEEAPKPEAPKKEASKPNPAPPQQLKGWGGGGWLSGMVDKYAPQVQGVVQKIQSSDQMKQVTAAVSQAGKAVSSFVNSIDSSRLLQIVSTHLVPKVVSNFAESSTCIHPLKISDNLTIKKSQIAGRSKVDIDAYVLKGNVGDRQMDVVVKLYPKELKIVSIFEYTYDLGILVKNGKMTLMPLQRPLISLFFRMPSEDAVITHMISQNQCLFTFQKVTASLSGEFNQTGIEYNALLGNTALMISEEILKESVQSVLRQNVKEGLAVLYDNQARRVDRVCVEDRAAKPHDCSMMDMTKRVV